MIYRFIGKYNNIDTYFTIIYGLHHQMYRTKNRKEKISSVLLALPCALSQVSGEMRLKIIEIALLEQDKICRLMC